MTSKPRQPKYKLNEPAARIPGGKTRPSVPVEGTRPSDVVNRERLNALLRSHDPETARQALAKITVEDFAILRQMAIEGAVTGTNQRLRQAAIGALGQHPTRENINLLSSLATAGEDAYVRAAALIGLGQSGLAVAAPILREGLAATDALEARSAERALEMLGRSLGPDVVATAFRAEKRAKVLASRDRVLQLLRNPVASSGRRKTRPKPRLTVGPSKR